VHRVNAERLVEQWTDLHGLAGTPAREERNSGHLRRVWYGADGTALVESNIIAGLAHGAPIHAGTGPGRCGVAGPATFDVGISSTHHIVKFWGLDSRENEDATHVSEHPEHSGRTATSRRV
jgi:poly(3-hydroxybutyrate) depolymerase